jgi:hypothetical protein
VLGRPTFSAVDLWRCRVGGSAASAVGPDSPVAVGARRYRRRRDRAQRRDPLRGSRHRVPARVRAGRQESARSAGAGHGGRRVELRRPHRSACARCLRRRERLVRHAAATARSARAVHGAGSPDQYGARRGRPPGVVGPPRRLPIGCEPSRDGRGRSRSVRRGVAVLGRHRRSARSRPAGLRRDRACRSRRRAAGRVRRRAAPRRGDLAPRRPAGCRGGVGRGDRVATGAHGTGARTARSQRRRARAGLGDHRLHRRRRCRRGRVRALRAARRRPPVDRGRRALIGAARDSDRVGDRCR